jgi:hypothetical protein
LDSTPARAILVGRNKPQRDAVTEQHGSIRNSSPLRKGVLL